MIHIGGKNDLNLIRRNKTRQIQSHEDTNLLGITLKYEKTKTEDQSETGSGFASRMPGRNKKW